MGKAAGEFLRLKRSLDSSYGSAAGLLTYTCYNKRVLDFIVTRISTSLGILLARRIEKDEIEKAQASFADSIGEHEIRDAGRDYAYFFHRGALAQLGGAA